jgi:hypothetical protein
LEQITQLQVSDIDDPDHNTLIVETPQALWDAVVNILKHRYSTIVSKIPKAPIPKKQNPFLHLVQREIVHPEPVL